MRFFNGSQETNSIEAQCNINKLAGNVCASFSIGLTPFFMDPLRSGVICDPTRAWVFCVRYLEDKGKGKEKDVLWRFRTDSNGKAKEMVKILNREQNAMKNATKNT